MDRNGFGTSGVVNYELRQLSYQILSGKMPNVRSFAFGDEQFSSHEAERKSTSAKFYELWMTLYLDNPTNNGSPQKSTLCSARLLAHSPACGVCDLFIGLYTFRPNREEPVRGKI